MQRSILQVIVLILAFASVCCSQPGRGKEMSLREWYVSDVNRKTSVSGNNEIQLSLEGASKEILIHKALGMNRPFVDSVLSDKKLLALYEKYKFDQLVFTNGSPNTMWKAKHVGTSYELSSTP